MPSERLGGNSTPEEMDDFNAYVADCGITDSPAVASLYTWSNKQDISSRVYSRLDRVLVNQAWLDDNSEVYAHFFTEGTFDQTPCVAQTQKNWDRKRRSFKYFNLWSQAEDFKDCVKDVWSKNCYGTRMYQLVCKLKALKGPLKQLNSANFNDIENNTARARINLEYIQVQIRGDPFNPDLIQQELEASSSVRWMEKACNDFLLQQSKAKWVDMGDNNTKYFPSIIKGRQVRNKVLRIEYSAGRLCDEPATIQSAFLDFYTSLLGSSDDVIAISQSVVQLGRGCTLDHQLLLLSPVTDQEIKEVMFSIPVHKAAGPDGYTSAFFRDSWDIVGGTVCAAIKDFSNMGNCSNN
ncbi:uncharacterized protein LOC141629656 [Silene latifolia]|uniref:uncharacterized protein LOC141629656 n=1 Tax=Silene latifolia TaxID=37657 RepID=UPI003D778E10